MSRRSEYRCLPAENVCAPQLWVVRACHSITAVLAAPKPPAACVVQTQRLLVDPPTNLDSPTYQLETPPEYGIGCLRLNSYEFLLAGEID
jgi:hypothetical protein